MMDDWLSLAKYLGTLFLIAGRGKVCGAPGVDHGDSERSRSLGSPRQATGSTCAHQLLSEESTASNTRVMLHPPTKHYRAIHLDLENFDDWASKNSLQENFDDFTARSLWNLNFVVMLPCRLQFLKDFYGRVQYLFYDANVEVSVA